jgi:hypothetical protein
MHHGFEMIHCAFNAVTIVAALVLELGRGSTYSDLTPDNMVVKSGGNREVVSEEVEWKRKRRNKRRMKRKSKW